MAGSPCVSFFFRQQLPLFKDSAVPRNFIRSKLANGFKCAGLTAADPTMTTFSVTFQAGSSYESRECNGNMYVLQRALANDARLSSVVAKTGALLSCNAGRELSDFTVQCRNEDVKEVAAALAQCLKTPPNQDAIAPIAQAALDGFYDDEMDPLVRTSNHLHDQCYQMHPLGNIPSGDPNALKLVTAQTVAEFAQENLTGARGALTVVAADPEKAINAAGAAFGELAAGEEAAPQYNRYVGGQQLENNEWYPYTHRAIGFRNNGWAGEDNLNLSLLQAMWGQWSQNDGVATASRVGRLAAVSYEQHAFVGMHTFYNRYRSTGLLGVVMKEKPNRANYDRSMGYGQREVVKTLVSTTHLLNDEELDMAKSQFKTNVLKRRDNPVTATLDMGEQLLQIDGYAYENMTALYESVNSVSKENIMDTCENFLHYADTAVAAVGCHGCPNDYGQWMRHETRFWRM